MSDFIAEFYSLSLLIIGVSHLVRPRLWADFFVELRKSTRFAPFLIGLPTLPNGLVIILGHNVWVFDLPVVITVVGWGWTIKATLYLLFPTFVERRVLERVLDERKRPTWSYVIVGTIMTLLGATLTYDTLLGSA